MDGLHIALALLVGLVSCSRGQMFGSVSEVTVRPGDNITVYCDCKVSTGVYIVWYRNCSHEMQPPLIIKVQYALLYNIITDYEMPYPNFEFLKNFSSDSYDLLIKNVTDSDEGLYYCGTETTKVEGNDTIKQILINSYGNITTRITCAEPDTRLQNPHHNELQHDCGSCWTLLFALCPGVAVLSSLLTAVVVYYCCQKTVQGSVNQQTSDTGGQTRQNQEEDVCYTTLEIRQPSQKPRKKNHESSDFCTYSAINTSLV